MDTTNARQRRGLEIAARSRIEHSSEGARFVHAQSKPGRYTVIMSGARGARCTCPDYETRGLDCTHVYAVRYVMEREQGANGATTVTRSVSVTETVKRTYPQNWPAYNAAQTNERDKFLVLLRDLCRGLPEPPQTCGRPRLSVADAVFSATFKVYSTLSARPRSSPSRAMRLAWVVTALIGPGRAHGERCSATSCIGVTSSWPTITSGRTSRRRSA